MMGQTLKEEIRITQYKNPTKAGTRTRLQARRISFMQSAIESAIGKRDSKVGFK